MINTNGKLKFLQKILSGVFQNQKIKNSLFVFLEVVEDADLMAVEEAEENI